MSSGDRLPARLADVAEAAGVSTATVSRVLGGSPHKVSAATRELVEKTAARLGYRVNPIARALRSSLTRSVGMVVPSIRNPFFTELVEEVEHALSAHDLNLFLSDSRGSVELEAKRLRSMSSGTVDGILLVPCHAERSAPAMAAAVAQVPVVQLDREVPSLRIPWVGVEDRSGIRDVMAHLHERGVRSIAHVTSTESSLSAAVRTQEVIAEAARLGITLRPEHLIDGSFSIAEGHGAAELLLRSGEVPDAVVCTDDLLALGVVAGLQAGGRSVPGDVLVTGFDDIELASMMLPSLTTVRQPMELIAAEAVRLLTQGRDATRSGARITIPGTLQVRQTTQPRA
ncbi:LacI family transcriptional regulator [Tessaracoccus rhinocerotis]|uniref:LacI family transcriptional regulator n=1 Tax=Tessaracoccus rhinocerotis TaxID=1689449 RepID=A0A553JW62_9ACTN|nr:LacI family DNA-binding transcriptional regulator [Tessaracoccus rhinocerotis]TRY16698.1 LacI family transcriptional regulator [Tessaracoccus rhinocerotis]